MKLDVKDLLIKAHDTPNPYAIKFVLNTLVKAEGKSTFVSPAECEHLPLVYSLFSIPGIKQVYLFQNTITITHTGELGGDDLKEHVQSVVRTRIQVHDPGFDPPAPEPVKTLARNKGLQHIEDILDRTVRPSLQADGGDIDVLELKNNELKIVYQGACGGCPSAMLGTLDAIQNILRHELENDHLFVTPV